MKKSKLDKIIKTKLLEEIEKSGGCINWGDLRSKVRGYFFAHKDQYKIVTLPDDKELTHALDLLEEDDAVERICEKPAIFYKLKQWGHILLKPWFIKWFYFLIKKNHNVISFIALAISVVALILSVIGII